MNMLMHTGEMLPPFASSDALYSTSQLTLFSVPTRFFMLLLLVTVPPGSLSSSQI